MLDIQQILSNFTQLNVLIIGDIMVDHYINGVVSRISPEAPVPIIDVNHEYYRLGGAANVALNVQSLGATSHLCGVIGLDENGYRLVNILKQEGIDSSLVHRSSLRKTIRGSRKFIRVDRRFFK